MKTHYVVQTDNEQRPYTVSSHEDHIPENVVFQSENYFEAIAEWDRLMEAAGFVNISLDGNANWQRPEPEKVMSRRMREFGVTVDEAVAFANLHRTRCTALAMDEYAVISRAGLLDRMTDKDHESIESVQRFMTANNLSMEVLK